MLALVGRERPSTALRAEIDRTLASHGGLVFVTGEAGIGKTALVAETVLEAERHGSLVASGTCWDSEGAPGYWPWVQVLRSLQRTLGPDAWTAARDAAGGELAMLLGEVDTPQRAGPAQTSFGLSDAVTSLLVTLSRQQPVVLVLDDLHWADPASLRLLEFVARHAWFEQLLVIGTYRDTEVEAPDHPLRPALLPLVAKATTVPLTGLDRDAVAELLERTADRQASDAVIAEVHRRTGGNPFFVDQTALLWHSTGSLATIPPSVRDTIDRRLRLLSDELRDLLTTAAVAGPELHRDLLAAASGHTTRAVERLLAEAAAAQVLTATAEHEWAFVHDLVRETLYAGMSEAETRRRHAAVLHAYLELPGSRAGCDPAPLAHHAYLAVPEVDPDEAVHLLRNAGRDAWCRFAVDEGAAHLRRALELLPQDQLRERAAVALELGSAQHHLGEMAATYRTFEEVAAIARKLDDPVLLARAALRLRGAVWLVYSEDMAQLVTRLVDEAYARLIGTDGADGNGDEATRVATSLRGTAAGSYLEREQALTARAVELHRESGDDDALFDSLVARWDAIWTPETAPERERLADEVSVVARRMSDRSAVIFGSVLRLVSLLEQGKPSWMDALAMTRSVAGQVDSSFARSMDLWLQAMLAGFTGRFDDSRTYMDEAEALDRRVLGATEEPNDWTAVRFQFRWGLELLQGRFDQAQAVLDAARDGEHPQLQLLQALTAVQQGDVEPARHYLAHAEATGDIPPRWFTPLWWRLRAQLAAATRDAALCEQVRREIAPAIDQWAVMFGDTPHGPLRLWSSLLDAAQGRWDDAVTGLTETVAAADRLDARPWSLEARLQLGRALLGRDGPGDADAAILLLDEVERDASELGMLDAVKRARRARPERTQPAVSAATVAAGRDTGTRQARQEAEATAAADTATPHTFRFDGRVWTLAFAGQTVHMPDAKGLRDIHVLLGRPGTDVPAEDLVNPETREVAQATHRLGHDPILDEQAKAAYRERLGELDELIDRAVSRQDDQRAAELDHERASLIDELRRATGLARRSRRLGNQAERARKAVSERVRDTLRRLDRSHPPLAEHLRASLSTGTTCRYQPDTPVGWQL